MESGTFYGIEKKNSSAEYYFVKVGTYAQFLRFYTYRENTPKNRKSKRVDWTPANANHTLDQDAVSPVVENSSIYATKRTIAFLEAARTLIEPLECSEGADDRVLTCSRPLQTLVRFFPLKLRR